MAQDLELRDYLRTILRRKMLIFVVSLLSALISIVWAKLQKPRFVATSEVKITRRRTFADLRQIPVFQAGNNIRTYVQEIRGYRLLRRAASQLYTSPAQIEDAVRRYGEAIAVEQESGTELISITMTSASNTETVAVVKALATAFVDYHTESISQGAQRMRRSIENWRDELLEQLANDERRIEEFRQKYNLIDVEAEGTTLVNRLATVDEAMGDLEFRQREVDGQIGFQKTQIAAAMAGESAGADKMLMQVGASLFMEGIKSRIFELDLERTGFLATGNYSESNPQVRRIDLLIKRVKDFRTEEVVSTVSANINRAQAEMSGFKARFQSLSERRSDINKRLQQLPELQQQIQEISRRKNIAEELAVFLSRRYEEARIAELDYPEQAEIVNVPKQATRVISHKAQVAVAGVILGILLGVGLAFLAESLDTSIATIAAFEETFNLPVLGVIPYVASTLRASQRGKRRHSFVAWASRFLGEPLAPLHNLVGFIFGRPQVLKAPYGIELAPVYTPKSPVVEALRTLRTNLDFYMRQSGIKSIMVTSANTGEGKTVLAINLALVMSQLGRKVLLVDGDMRKPRLHEVFGLPKDPGLSDVLLGDANWQSTLKGMADVAVGSKADQELFRFPGLDNLHMITCGAVAQHPSEWWSLPKAKEFLDAARETFDLIIVDTPPLLPVPDSMIVGRLVDGILLVYEVGHTAREAMRRSILNLTNGGGKPLGFVLNGLRSEYASNIDFSAYRYYYGGYGPTTDKAEKGVTG